MNIVNINGYSIERKDRDSCTDIQTDKGGGIVIYIRDKLEYTRRHDLESPDIQSIWIEVKIKNAKSFLICSVYRPPSSTADWPDIFSRQIEMSLSSNNEIYLMGDFNIDIKAGKLSNTKWKHVIQTNDLHQLIDEPTRVTAHPETIIDHLYTTTPESVKDIHIPKVAVSDHYPIQFTRLTGKSHIKRQQHTIIHYRSFNNFNEEQFLSDLSDNMSSLDVSPNDSDLNFNNFINSFMTIFEKHAPMKTKRVKNENQPEWFNEHIKSASKTRDMYHKAKNWPQYKYWRNKTTDLIRSAKKDFFAQSIADNKDNAYLWKHIKSLNGQLHENKIPDEMIYDGQPTTDTLSILEKLNQYFSTISERLQAEQPQNSPEFDSENLENYIKSKVPNNIKFSTPYMKLTDLIATLNTLNVTKATGLDGLTPKILKTSANAIAPTLLKIINTSLQNGQFPEPLKIAKLKPIHKGGPKSDPSNYRPISVLPVLSKIIEKHITKHIFAYLSKYDILHKSQSGFRKNHSCNTALISLLDEWLKNIDKGEITGAIFFDLRKAFDVVDHEILLQKLRLHNFDSRAMTWMQSYLSNRYQCIVTSKISSSLQQVKSGVPQGSVLGPALFLIFINDMPLFINEAYAEIYADDTTVHTASKDEKVIETKLQVSATNFKSWCLQHKMFVHLAKTSFMNIGTRQNLLNIDNINIIIDNENISGVENQKLLGIIIDKTLSWDKQIDSVCLNISRRITLLKILSKYVDESSLKQYYNAYILPIFDYGCMIWGQCSTYNMNRLLKLQKRAARIILQADFMTPSKQMFQKLGWLTFAKRVQYHTCVMVFKSLNGLAPEYLTNLLTRQSETHSRNLRSNDKYMLKIPFARTAYYEKSFSVTGPRLWNSLPLQIRQSTGLNSFTKLLKVYLLNN